MRYVNEDHFRQALAMVEAKLNHYIETGHITYIAPQTVKTISVDFVRTVVQVIENRHVDDDDGDISDMISVVGVNGRKFEVGVGVSLNGKASNT
jgi:hypothetical protein